MQTSSAGTLILVRQVQLLLLQFAQMNISYDIQRPMTVHNLYAQFSPSLQPTILSPRQERLCMQSLVGSVIGIDYGWQSFEVATPFGTGLYDS